MTNANGGVDDEPLDELQPHPPARRFLCDDVEWLAWPSGSSAYGTGTCGAASIEAVHFARAEAPDTPVFEGLLPTGRFHGLFDDELIALLRTATRVVDASDRPLKPASRRGVGLL